MIPEIIAGGIFNDYRGELQYNNSFNMSEVKRIYSIKNSKSNPFRRWQGHKIEMRWFIAIKGVFSIELIEIDNWETPSRNLRRLVYKLDDRRMDVLSVPPGYVSSISSLEDSSKLLVMSDYYINEVKDDFKFPEKYFN